MDTVAKMQAVITHLLEQHGIPVSESDLFLWLALPGRTERLIIERIDERYLSVALARAGIGTVGIGAVLAGVGAGTVAVGVAAATGVGKTNGARGACVTVGAIVGRATVFVAADAEPGEGRAFPGPEHATRRKARMNIGKSRRPGIRCKSSLSPRTLSR